MTTQEGVQDSRGEPARRHLHDKAYFLDLLGDRHNGLTRHETLARQQLAHCQAELAGALLPGRSGRAPGPPHRTAIAPLGSRARPAETLSPYSRDGGRFLLCPGPMDSHVG
jgi:hypothetical protein